MLCLQKLAPREERTGYFGKRNQSVNICEIAISRRFRLPPNTENKQSASHFTHHTQGVAAPTLHPGAARLEPKATKPDKTV